MIEALSDPEIRGLVLAAGVIGLISLSLYFSDGKW